MNAAKHMLLTLNLSQLTLAVGRRDLIQSLNLTIAAGQCWCVLGPNGSGKSTLLRAIAGFDAGLRSQISLGDDPLSAIDPEKLALLRAYLPQEQHDVFGMSVLQTVMLARHPHAVQRRWESQDDIAAAMAALTQMDVSHLAQRDVRALSGGERQRVALAALFAQETPLLILDEPTNHLDLPHQMALMEQLRQACQGGEHTVVMAVHDINVAARVATHVLMLLPDQQWLAGPIEAILNAENLQTCLGYPVQAIENKGRPWWVPVE